MAVEFRLRPATPEDKESIQRVYSYLVGPPTGQEQTWQRLINERHIMVAEVDAQVVAFGGIDLEADEQLKWLYVLPEYQTAGIGSKILNQLEGIGWTAGLNSIHLHAAPGAFLFYRRHGYREVEGDDLAHDHDGITMVKDIL